MAARFLYDRIDLHHVRIEPRIPPHYLFVKVLLIPAARDRQAREPPPELSFKKMFVLHCFLPRAGIAFLSQLLFGAGLLSAVALQRKACPGPKQLSVNNNLPVKKC